MTPIDRIILANPSLLNLKDIRSKGGVSRSWIQLARTGSFTSSRYGTFSITKDDLATMLHNFTDITPKAPTELPIDYDHLSMDPKKPGDGVAAGWMKKLELREDGDELWAEIEWTPDGAERIANQEYRFVSPSFVKDHTHKDGKKIGTTLLAAAITNHPFLEGMKALTLYNFSTLGDLALNADAVAHPVVNLADVGQRVMIAPGHARTQDEVGGTFEIIEVVGDGENAFVTIKDANGVPHKWFRMTELLPASATPASPIQKNLEPAPGAAVTDTQEGTMNDSTKTLLGLAETYAKAHHCSLGHAVIRVSAAHPGLTAAYRDEVGANAEPPAQAPVISLRSHADATQELMALANTIAAEQHVSLSAAVKVAGQQRPDLGAAWERG